jgi:hypothetical protein
VNRMMESKKRFPFLFILLKRTYILSILFISKEAEFVQKKMPSLHPRRLQTGTGRRGAVGRGRALVLIILTLFIVYITFQWIFTGYKDENHSNFNNNNNNSSQVGIKAQLNEKSLSELAEEAGILGFEQDRDDEEDEEEGEEGEDEEEDEEEMKLFEWEDEEEFLFLRNNPQIPDFSSLKRNMTYFGRNFFRFNQLLAKHESNENAANDWDLASWNGFQKAVAESIQTEIRYMSWLRRQNTSLDFNNLLGPPVSQLRRVIPYNILHFDFTDSRQEHEQEQEQTLVLHEFSQRFVGRGIVITLGQDISFSVVSIMDIIKSSRTTLRKSSNSITFYFFKFIF